MYVNIRDPVWLLSLADLLDVVQSVSKLGGVLRQVNRAELPAGAARFFVDWLGFSSTDQSELKMYEGRLQRTLGDFRSAKIDGDYLVLWTSGIWQIAIGPLSGEPAAMVIGDEVEAFEIANQQQRSIAGRPLSWWTWALGEDISRQVESRIRHQEHVLGPDAIIDAAHVCHSKKLDGSKVAYFFGVCKGKAETLARTVLEPSGF